MSDTRRIEGIAAPLPVANLDTDQIMPKQFLRGIDKAGLDRGLFHDMRFDGEGRVRRDFVLNRPEFAGARVLVGGANFGCGSSREHAVWGLQQYGIQAVIAPSFGEIFYSNAMNNGLMLVMLPPEDVQALLEEISGAGQAINIEIDVEALTVRTPRHRLSFALAERHRRMFIEGLDMIGTSLTYQAAIAAFSRRHWEQQPWMRDVAARTRQRLSEGG